jgi:two-component system NtrC family sensor kinase
VISGHAEALEPLVEDERGRWRLQTIREQVDRISRIIQALLNMARPRETVREPVEIEPLLDTTLSFVAVKLNRRDVRVERDYAPVPSVLGDPEKLQQLFLNLSINAADAMESRGGTLRVSLGCDEDGAVEILFADTGTGIPDGELERIFEPFFTTKPAGQGNGLGLVVADGIVRDHGGRIDVESAEDEGTTFRIHLPAATEPEAS